MWRTPSCLNSAVRFVPIVALLLRIICGERSGKIPRQVQTSATKPEGRRLYGPVQAGDDQTKSKAKRFTEARNCVRLSRPGCTEEQTTSKNGLIEPHVIGTLTGLAFYLGNVG